MSAEVRADRDSGSVIFQKAERAKTVLPGAEKTSGQSAALSIQVNESSARAPAAAANPAATNTAATTASATAGAGCRWTAAVVGPSPAPQPPSTACTVQIAWKVVVENGAQQTCYCPDVPAPLPPSVNGYLAAAVYGAPGSLHLSFAQVATGNGQHEPFPVNTSPCAVGATYDGYTSCGAWENVGTPDAYLPCTPWVQACTPQPN